jgi:hypothetical protein
MLTISMKLLNNNREALNDNKLGRETYSKIQSSRSSSCLVGKQCRPASGTEGSLQVKAKL